MRYKVKYNIRQNYEYKYNFKIYKYIIYKYGV